MLVGLTGGIGSGKTAAGDRFASLGINVVDADLASRAVVEPGLPALAAITDHFGDTVLTPEGRLDRPVLRQRVFADGDERRWLQNLLHPLIQDYLREQIDASTSPYCLLVNPLLFESGQNSWCDTTIVVDVPVETQIERTMARDDNPRTQVQAILDAQMERTARLGLADHVTTNDQDLDYLHEQVDTLHEALMNRA